MSRLAHELESAMLRYLGISFLLLGLLAAGYDGFRERERADGPAKHRRAAAVLHLLDGAVILPN